MRYRASYRIWSSERRHLPPLIETAAGRVRWRKRSAAALLRRRPGAHALWAFDALMVNGKDLRGSPYSERRNRLWRIVGTGQVIRYSQAFDDGEALLRACAEHGLEGVVAKRIDAPYRSGKSRSWVKVKTTTWIELNRRRRLFEG